MTLPQADTPTDTQPVLSEPPLPQEEPSLPAWWRVHRSALLLIGGPIAGALLVWLGISAFKSDPAPAPAAVIDQPAPAPAVETQPAMEASVAGSAEADPASVEPEWAPVESESAPVEPESAQVASELREQPDAPSSAINEVMPRVPQSALDTIRGTVRVSVRVTIDKQGAVIDATPDDGGPSRYFERLSVDASRKWTFAPAGVEEQRTMLVKFNFTREGVTARAEPDEARE